MIKNRTIVKNNNATTSHFNHYIASFVDGEGCFSVSFRKLERLKVKVEVRPSFSIGQRATPANFELLEKIKTVFKGGSTRVDRASNLYKYETRSSSHILNNVVPFFEQYPLHGEKRHDLLNFCKVCRLIAKKRHLTVAGLSKIIDIAKGMNTSGKRRVLLSGLRDHLSREAVFENSKDGDRGEKGRKGFCKSSVTLFRIKTGDKVFSAKQGFAKERIAEKRSSDLHK